MSKFTSGRVRFPNYKGGNPTKGAKNCRRHRRSKQRNEEKIILQLEKLARERAQNLEKARYAKEARDYETRYDYM